MRKSLRYGVFLHHGVVYMHKITTKYSTRVTSKPKWENYCIKDDVRLNNLISYPLVVLTVN